MSEISVFLKPPEYYQRKLNPIGQYTDQMAYYLSKMSGQTKDTCKGFVVNGIKNRQFKEIRDPLVHHFERDDNGDRSKTETPLSRYINQTVLNDEILVPTFTVYINTKVTTSLLVEFIDNNVKRRSKAKKEAFKAKVEGNIDLFIAKNNEQNNMKLYNNSLSGTFASVGNMLHNPTGHNTLTSIIRLVSSIGNASNEKIVAGNRHYRSPDVTLFNIISIANSADRDSLQRAINTNKLRYPTVEETIDCIKFSSDLYWRDERAFQPITDLIAKLDDLERAAVVYSGDLYHLRKYNEEFIRNFIKRLSSKITGVTVDNQLDVIRKTDESMVNFAHQICYDELKGIGKEYEKMPIEHQHILAATCNNINTVINDYYMLIDGLLITNTMPSSIAYIPNMVRRTVVLSDTDSTMFSADEWVTWYFGELVFNTEALAVASSVMFLATQCIAHTMAMYSANMNVAKEKLYDLKMKPEFTFPVFAQSPVAKHYYTCLSVQEGNVFSDTIMEIKGIWLKNSASPKTIIKPAQAKMKTILDTIMSNKKISMLTELKDVADIERKIISSLLNGETEFYRTSRIKQPEAYTKSAEESPYIHHVLWKEVFAAKYGDIDSPPYSVIKIPTNVTNVSSLAKWLESITDIELAERLGNWFKMKNKVSLPTMYISLDYAKAFGIPIEIKTVIDTKKIALDLTVTNRLILQTLGYFPKSDILISEVGY